MMEREIGGNFCEELSKNSRKLKDSKKILWFDTGRSAIRCLLDFLGEKIKRVMLPQYVCESVLKPFIEREYQIIYYPVDRNLQLLREDFERLLEVGRPQLVLVQSYFGFDTLGQDRTFLRGLSIQGIIVVEDITHSLLSDYWHSCADYMVGSLRKWCSIPDGGILIKASNNDESDEFEILYLEENVEFLNIRLAAQQEKRKFLSTDNRLLDKRKFISLFDKSENILDGQNKYYTMSVYTRERINSIDWQKIADRRRENYCTLKKSLTNTEGIETLFTNISSDTVPLYFPVFIDGNKRDSLRNSMREENILLPVIWPVSSFLTNCLTVDVHRIYSEILAIPCDQRYTVGEMCFIVDKIRQKIKERI